MPLSRFFGGGKPREPDDQPASGSDAAADDTDDSHVDDADAAPEDAPATPWRTRAMRVLPTGASTGSKRFEALYGADAGDEPTHFVSSVGCVLTDTEGFGVIDCTMALGAVALGYAEPRVTQAVVAAVTEGNVSALSSWREVALAERLCSMVPCAERAQFFKTGAEAVSAAVRIARTYTNREQVIAAGYFGWHDWSGDAAGIPASTRALTTRVAFDDIVALDAAASAAGTTLAAIVIEPVVERAPSEQWLARAREICTAQGAVLVFDELKTGFRVAPAGWQEITKVVPDLAVYGKAMANGFPLAALVGREAVMDATRATWISSTLASESSALAAALAVLDWHDEADIASTLAETGREMRASIDRAISASGTAGVTTQGIDPMWRMTWDDPARESRFLRHALRAGVLFKKGAYNFAAIAHDEDTLRDIETAASAAFVALREEERG